MKKIFTLLFAVGLFTAASAQYKQQDNRQKDQRKGQQTDQRNHQQTDQDKRDNGYAYGKDNNRYDKNNRYDNNRNNNNNNLGRQIARINREYDYKIHNVQNNRFMSRSEKRRQIRYLQDQRQHEIQMLKAGNNRNDRNRFDMGHNSNHNH